MCVCVHACVAPTQLHATHCPQRQFASNMICKIAAIVVVRSADGCVLLTRRASHMRTFPNVWVSVCPSSMMGCAPIEHWQRMVWVGIGSLCILSTVTAVRGSDLNVNPS